MNIPRSFVLSCGWYYFIVRHNIAGVMILKKSENVRLFRVRGVCWERRALVNAKWTLGFHKRRAISWLVQQLLASQEELPCMDLVPTEKWSHVGEPRKRSLYFKIILSSSSSSSSPLYRVFIHIFLSQTMSLRNTVFQLFCHYYLRCLYR